MRLFLLLAVVALAACGGGIRPAPSAQYDLGTASVVWQPQRPPLRGIAVAAPSWLGGRDIHYRLLYADPLRRQAYAEGRWAAPPAELIERALSRQARGAGTGCTLRLELDELAQVFDAPQASRTLLEVRASLVAPERAALLARKAFALAAPAPSADARGGVAAAAAAVQALGGELGAWLEHLVRENPALAQRCGPG